MEPTVDENDVWDDQMWASLAQFDTKPNNVSNSMDGDNRTTSPPDINSHNNSNITQFLTKNRIEELQSCFIKHKITMEDLQIWIEQDAKEYCTENAFGTHIKRRLINAISKLNSNSILYSIHTNINKLQQQQLQSDISMKNSFNKISKQMHTIASTINTSLLLSNVKCPKIQTSIANQHQCNISHTNTYVPNNNITVHKPLSNTINPCTNLINISNPCITVTTSSQQQKQKYVPNIITHKLSSNTMNTSIISSNKIDISKSCIDQKECDVDTSFRCKQYISTCDTLIYTFNKSSKKCDLKEQHTTPTVSTFFERKYGCDRWIKVTTSEAEIAFQSKLYESLMDIAKNGIKWKNKIWKYFCHKDNVLYFFHETENIKIKNVRQCLGDIYSTKSIAKFASRLSLGFSKTYPINIKIKSSNIHIISDIKSQQTDCIMSDGSGYIAVNLAKQIPTIAGGYLKNTNYKNINKEYPLLIQCRIVYSGGLAKGVLVANPSIPDGEIHLTESMIKIKNNDEFKQKNNNEYAMIEVNNTSTVGHQSTLNTNFNIILSQLTAVNNDETLFREYISGLLKSYFQSLQEIIENPRTAYRKLKYLLTTFQQHSRRKNTVSDTYEYQQEFQVLIQMLLAGQNMNDPFLQSSLQKIVTKSFDKISYQGHIPVECSTYLMGTYDPLNVLEENEVFIACSKSITGKVLISRNPSCMPGDIRIFNAVNKSKLHDFMGFYNRKKSGGIFFSVKGKRAAADLLSNGDYDGDIFWICYDQELIKLVEAKQVYEAAPIDFADPFKWNEEYKNNNNDLQWDLVRKSPMTFIDCNENNINIALMTHFVLSNCNSMNMKMSNTIWKKCFELYGLFDEKTTLAARCYFVSLDAAKSGIKVEIPENIRNKTKDIIFPYNKDLNKHVRNFESSKQIRETNSILMFVFKKVKEFENEFLHIRNGVQSNDIENIQHILDEDILAKRSFLHNDGQLINIINSMDDNLTREFVLIKAKHEVRKQKTVDEYDNFNYLKQIQYEYNNEVYLLKEKYRKEFEEYCVNNNIQMEILAAMLYEISYKKVFESNTRNSYWIPWMICSNVLNQIKAQSQCTNTQNVIIVSPNIFKTVLLRKR